MLALPVLQTFSRLEPELVLRVPDVLLVKLPQEIV